MTIIGSTINAPRISHPNESSKIDSLESTIMPEKLRIWLAKIGPIKTDKI